MDPFDLIGKRIQDLSAVYDDDGPSAMVPESRTMFNDGGMLVQPSNDGSRPGYAAPVKLKTSDDKIISQWRKSLEEKNPKAWRSYLADRFGEKTSNTLRTRIRNKVKNFNPGEEFSTKVTNIKNQKKISLVTKLVNEHNTSDSYLYDREAIYKKLGEAKLTGGTKFNKGEGINDQLLDIMDNMDTPEKKIAKAFDKIIDEDIEIYKPKNIAKTKGTYGLLKQMISDTVSPKGGSRHYQIGANTISKTLNKHEPYLNIKDDIDYFDKYHSTKFKGKKFSEGFNYSKYMRGGLKLKNLRDFSGSFARPESQIYSFAARHAFLNNKLNTPSQIQFYKLRKDGSKGSPINFNDLPKDSKTFARALDSDKYGFNYKGQFFNKDNLKTKGFKSGLFDEVYNITKKGETLVPDPKNPKKQIALKTLLKDAGDKLTIGHNDALGGVKASPFNSLRIEGGKFNIALFNAYDKIKNKQARKMIVDNLQGKFLNLKGDDYEKAFIDSKIKEASNISNKPTLTPYRSAGQQVIKDLGQDILKKSKPFQTEISRVAGLKNVKGLIPFMKSLGIKCQLSNGINCMNPQAYTKSLNELSEKAAQGNTEAASKLKNFSSKALKTGKVLKNVLGPLAIASEVALEGGIALNKTLETGVPFKQAFGESYLNKLLGPKTQIDVEAERAKEMARGEEYAMAERGRRMAPFMAQSKAADERRLKNRMQQMEEVNPTVAVPQIDIALQDAGLTQQETGMTYPELQDYIKKESQMQAIADAGGVANLAGGGIAKMAGDRSGPPPVSGPNSQGLQGLFNRVKKV